jgi:pyruvate dehydrogenase E2 component (dihydrolipoamide acetyltransferase)
LESPGTGTLTGILLQAGETVPVGRPIAAILKAGESLPAGWGSGSSATASSAETAPASAPAASIVTETTTIGSTADLRLKASPLAKKVAADKGVDLSNVQGTGPGGRIVEKDVLAAAIAAPTPASSPAPTAAPMFASAEDQVIKLPKLRQITAKRTTESKQQVPHFYVSVEVDVENIGTLRGMFESQDSGKVSVNDFVIKACALALRDMPAVNAVYQGDQITIYGGVHVGMAVALEDGLTVPVIKNADQLSLRQISAKSKELAKKARENKLSLDELTGSTFSISNMGMLDVDNFLAIINQPNSAIVAIASARKKVVVNDDDEIEVRSRMNITGSFDHRALDGAVGARFINKIKEYLENPTRLLS